MITVNGNDLSTIISVTGITGRGPIEQDIESLTVPGKPGAYFVEKVIPPRNITVSFEMTGNSLSDIRTKVDQLNAKLKFNAPSAIVFTDEPTKTYFGIVSGKPNWDEFLFIGKGTITFYCADPFKYGIEQTASYAESTNITVNGNENSDPITTITVSADTSYISLYNGTTGKINLLGMPAKQSETVTEKETTNLKSTCDNLTGWTAPASTEDAPITGTMSANGGFYSSSYGTNLTSWHGPAMKTSLASSITDFRFDMGFAMSKTGDGINQAGGIIVTLLDGQNNVVAKCQMFKHHGNLNTYYATFQAGKNSNGYRIINELGYNREGFTGVFRIYRTGTKWIVQIFENTPSGFKPPYSVDWTDSNNIATATITQVQVQLLQRTNFPLLDQSIGDIVAYRQNTLTSNQVPYVARNGDVIEFNHKNSVIRKNGIDVTKDKAFIGEYFPLVPGLNTLIAAPISSFSSVVTKWQDKWL